MQNYIDKIENLNETISKNHFKCSERGLEETEGPLGPVILGDSVDSPSSGGPNIFLIPMATRFVEFSSGGYKFRNIFA